MDDLISRQAAIDFIDAGRLGNPNEPRWSDNEVDAFLKSRPSAERHGRWIVKPHKMMGECPCCSECGSFNPIKYRYCPNCGAKMDLEVRP